MLANANITSSTADGDITGVDFIPAGIDDEDAADEDAKDKENNEFYIDPLDDPLPELLEVEEEGVVKLSIMNNTIKIFRDYPEEIGKPCAMPTSDHLFVIRDPDETERLGKYLPEEMAQQFHHTVKQLLFIATRVRRDIQTVVAFLTTESKSQMRMTGES